MTFVEVAVRIHKYKFMGKVGRARDTSSGAACPPHGHISSYIHKKKSHTRSVVFIPLERVSEHFRSAALVKSIGVW